MYYKDILTEVLDSDHREICISVDLCEIQYPLSFIYDETDTELIICSTGDDGYERMVVINKDKIYAVNVVYEQDIEDILDDKKEVPYHE